MRAASPYLSATWRLVGGAVFGVTAGYFLDRWLGTTPFILLGLSTVGIGVGFYAFIKTMMKLGSGERPCRSATRSSCGVG